MINAIFGKKIGMTQIFNEEDKLIPVTVIQAEPNTVCQVKTKATDGYEAVRSWLRHVHIKDAKLDADGNPQCVCIGTGAVDYPRLLRALLRDGYQGWLSLETHYRKNAVISEALMRQPGGAAFSEGGLAATAESIDALRTLLAQAKEDFT